MTFKQGKSRNRQKNIIEGWEFVWCGVFRDVCDKKLWLRSCNSKCELLCSNIWVFMSHNFSFLRNSKRRFFSRFLIRWKYVYFILSIKLNHSYSMSQRLTFIPEPSLYVKAWGSKTRETIIKKIRGKLSPSIDGWCVW